LLSISAIACLLFTFGVIAQSARRKAQSPGTHKLGTNHLFTS
jgi:hypothetical protein